MDINKIKNYANRLKEETVLVNDRLIAKLTGVTFDGRQENIALLDGNTKLKLQRDRRNTYDFFAVSVLAEVNGSWIDVGFIPRPMNKKLCSMLDNGDDLDVVVHRITGGMVSSNGEQLNRGLEVRITKS